MPAPCPLPHVQVPGLPEEPRPHHRRPEITGLASQPAPAGLPQWDRGRSHQLQFRWPHPAQPADGPARSEAHPAAHPHSPASLCTGVPSATRPSSLHTARAPAAVARAVSPQLSLPLTQGARHRHPGNSPPPTTTPGGRPGLGDSSVAGGHWHPETLVAETGEEGRSGGRGQARLCAPLWAPHRLGKGEPPEITWGGLKRPSGLRKAEETQPSLPAATQGSSAASWAYALGCASSGVRGEQNRTPHLWSVERLSRRKCNQS